MSAGETHAQVSRILAPLAAIATGAFCHTAGSSLTNSVLAGLGAAVGCGVVGLVLGPDLDQPGVTIGEWTVIKWLGPLGWLFVAYWWLYAKIFKHPTTRKRSLSHMPIVSTVIRVVYMFWPLWFIRTDVPGWALVIFAGMVVGLMVSDAGHWAMDRMGVG